LLTEGSIRAGPHAGIYLGREEGGNHRQIECGEYETNIFMFKLVMLRSYQGNLSVGNMEFKFSHFKSYLL